MGKTELAVIIPVYNEAEIIAQVVGDWDHALKQLSMRYEIHVYNDGSKDGTLAVLEQIADQYPSLNIHNKANSGHGSTILTGYRENLDAEWIFQVDSDNEISPVFFKQFWNERSAYDFIAGIRAHAKRPVVREVVSSVSRLLTRTLYAKGNYDVNVPYRLMRSEAFAGLIDKIPLNTFAPNVIISGCAALHKLRIREIPISSNLRQSGEVSIKKWRLFKAVVKSFAQTIAYRFTHA